MIKIAVPATSANCGVGFDCLGMAMDWWATFTFEKSDVLQISGCPTQFQNEENLVVQSFYATCDALDKEYPVFSLHMDNEIPFQRGLGTSALCIVAGILAADQWFDAHLDPMRMLSLATEIEGHPDNVAPAIFGQAVVSVIDQGKPQMVSVPCANWQVLAMIPESAISTEQARNVLPASIEFPQACHQVAHALIFSRALQIGDESLLFNSCKDVLHQPYRKQFIKQYDAIADYCQEHQLPMWISGSGSTLIAVSMRSNALEDLKQWVEQTQGIQTKRIRIAQKGATVLHE